MRVPVRQADTSWNDGSMRAIGIVHLGVRNPRLVTHSRDATHHGLAIRGLESGVGGLPALVADAKIAAVSHLEET